ncbi:aldose epimerase family protein [Compostibacter hankyongensis]|uniref:Aldose 1-epimerase n=1 Tax=Compostibacter hankyongensis TaxID=1007089 RepID=A0ABP8FHB6_9BACT
MKIHQRSLTFTSSFALAFFAGILLLASCQPGAPSGEAQGGDSAAAGSALIPDAAGFRDTINGKATNLYVLKNHSGMQAAVTNYGGRLVSLVVPDKNGTPTDVVAGFDNVEGYVKSTEPYFGATIGRYGNRIAKGKFSLDGKSYTLFINNPPNALHGGKPGFQEVVWDASQLNDSTLELRYLAKDMEAGFPGNLQVKVTYALTADNALKLDYEAVTDKKTVVNLTNHAFFNLNGWGSGTILNHLLWVNADRYTPIDSTFIPAGKLASVEGTPFDFRKATAIGARIGEDNEQLKNGRGYDHNFVLNEDKGSGLNHAATVTGDQSGIVMDVYTREPGLQFYSGNFMESKNAMSGGHKDDPRTAFAMETQHFPDSPNRPDFPSTVLKPGDTYRTESLYKFSVKP